MEIEFLQQRLLISNNYIINSAQQENEQDLSQIEMDSIRTGLMVAFAQQRKSSILTFNTQDTLLHNQFQIVDSLDQQEQSIQFIKWCLPEDINTVKQKLPFDFPETSSNQQNQDQQLENSLKKQILKISLQSQEKMRQCHFKWVNIQNPFLSQNKAKCKKDYLQYIKNYQEININSVILKKNQKHEKEIGPIQSVIQLRQLQNYCPHQGCRFITCSRSKLKSHVRNLHSLVVFKCGQQNCNYQTKIKQCLKQHQKNVHSKNILKCQNENCDYKTKIISSLQTHMQAMHSEEGYTIYECQFPGCGFKSKNRRSCNSHKLNVHSTQIYSCPRIGCEFKSKSKKCLYHHKIYVHSTKLVYCTEEGCEFTAKNRAIIINHIKHVHEIAINNVKKPFAILWQKIGNQLAII